MVDDRSDAGPVKFSKNLCHVDITGSDSGTAHSLATIAGWKPAVL